MEFRDVIEQIANKIDEFVGYTVVGNKGKAREILYSHIEEMATAALVDLVDANAEKPFEDIIKVMADEIYDFACGKSVVLDDIISYYTPLIEQSAVEAKYINESADELMDDFPQDGSMQEKTDFFIALKEKEKLLKSKLSAITNVQQQVMPELIAWIESNPASQLVATNGKRASIRISYYPKVTNLQDLKNALAEQWEEFEGVDTKKLGALVREIRDRAKASDTDIHELLPPGADVSISKTLTVSAPGAKTKRGSDEEVSNIVDMLMDKGGNE